MTGRWRPTDLEPLIAKQVLHELDRNTSIDVEAEAGTREPTLQELTYTDGMRHRCPKHLVMITARTLTFSTNLAA
jgi:hypothetical protein